MTTLKVSIRDIELETTVFSGVMDGAAIPVVGDCIVFEPGFDMYLVVARNVHVKADQATAVVEGMSLVIKHQTRIQA